MPKYLLFITGVGRVVWKRPKKPLRSIKKGFHQVWYQGIVKAIVFRVLEDLKFKISEGSDQN